MGDIVIALDTSGSIGSKELEPFAGEINAIASEAQPESIRVIYCDAIVQGVEEFGPAEPIKLSPKGGGGTDFVPVFRWVEENGIEPKCFIYLTDLCCNSFPPAPDYPVLWVTDSQKIAPLGKRCEYALVVDALHRGFASERHAPGPGNSDAAQICNGSKDRGTLRRSAIVLLPILAPGLKIVIHPLHDQLAHRG